MNEQSQVWLVWFESEVHPGAVLLAVCASEEVASSKVIQVERAEKESGYEPWRKDARFWIEQRKVSS